MAIDGVPLAILKMAVPNEDRETPFILLTTRAPSVSVTSPVWVLLETLALLATCSSKMVGLIRPLVLVEATGIASLPPVRWVLAWLDGTLTPASEIVRM